jgi:hypothetical protein
VATAELTEFDKLFQVPLTEFTSARNALAAKLKKEGDAESAERVKTLGKPSVSAWVANQLYWKYGESFERLLAAGEQFREAQSAQLSGKTADLRAPLEARREALAELTRLASDILRDTGHPPSPETMRRVTTTLEALATYGEQPGAPQPGRLTGDVAPPGFEALAALVPRGIDRVGQRQAPPRVIPFSHQKPHSKRKSGDAEQDARAAEAERRAREAQAQRELRDAERALMAARKAAKQAEAAMKEAAARAKAAEKAKASLESRFEKLSAAAEAARQDARKVASKAEEAAQAVDDAERAVRTAREKLKG